MRAKCPSCSIWVELEDDVEVGDQVECPPCEELLQVLHRNPPKLDYYFGDYDGEDEEDEDEDEGW